MSMYVEISQEALDKGERCSREGCALALALKKAGITDPEVTMNAVFFSNADRTDYDRRDLTQEAMNFVNRL